MAIIVSAYFKIPSKASHEFYLEHLKRFLTNIKTNIVFFTTPDLVETLQHIRGDLPINFQLINSIYDIVAFKRYGYDFWQKQCNIDVEKYHTPEVAAIWYEKKEFIKKTIQLYKSNDPSFNTPLIWCDAGCVRDNNWINIIKSFGSNINVIPKNKLLLQTFKDIPINKKFFMFPDQYLAGAIITGYPETWLICSDLYDKTLKNYENYNICCNSDQYLWASTVNDNPDNFELIHVKECINNWFYFLEYLS